MASKHSFSPEECASCRGLRVTPIRSIGVFQSVGARGECLGASTFFPSVPRYSGSGGFFQSRATSGLPITALFAWVQAGFGPNFT